MALKKTPVEALRAFYKLKQNTIMRENNNQLSREQLLDFVNEYFDPPGAELEEFTPSDWKEK
jgi:hypothetical protein